MHLYEGTCTRAVHTCIIIIVAVDHILIFIQLHLHFRLNLASDSQITMTTQDMVSRDAYFHGNDATRRDRSNNTMSSDMFLWLAVQAAALAVSAPNVACVFCWVRPSVCPRVRLQ